MPQRRLAASPHAVAFKFHSSKVDLGILPIANKDRTIPLAQLLMETGTTAFLALSDGEIAWEHYPNGGSRERLNRAFSVTKSVASALVGVALGAGRIASIEEPIGRYLPELRDQAPTRCVPQ